MAAGMTAANIAATITTGAVQNPVSGAIALLTDIGAIVYNIQAFRSMYGENYKEKSKGQPGSFSVRHPFISFLVPLVSEVSAVRGYLHIKNDCTSGRSLKSLRGCGPRCSSRRLRG